MMRRGYISSLCALVLWIGGCPKRQETRRSTIVYVQAPPPAAAPAAASSATKPQDLVIEEPPPPPEPEETPPPQTPEPTPPHRQKHPSHTEAPSEPDESPAPESTEAPPAEVPALEPRQSTAQENELRRQFLSLEQDIEKRLAQLSGAHLSENDQKALEDARTFFAQARQALASGDLPRALNLARKAGLLLAALQ